MSSSSQSIFREAALDRLSSPDQLDRAVVITRPADWIAGGVIALTLVVLLGWAIFGKVPTRVGGEGILVGERGRLVEAAAAAPGRIASVDVAIGDRVVAGQPIARLAQDDISDRRSAAAALLVQRRQELAALQAASQREQRAEDSSNAARKAGYAQLAAAADDRAAVLSREVRTTGDLLGQGLATEPDLERLRAELAAARQRGADARNAILTLEAEQIERRRRRSRELLDGQFRQQDAERETAQLGGLLDRNSQILSPTAGQVTEIKASAGSVVAPGAPVAVIQSGQARLRSVVYLPPETGKLVRPGMAVRVEPATVKREEHGTLRGRVVSVSPFPATPEGMAATLHNGDLVQRFRRQGAPYAVVLSLEADAGTPSGYRWSSGRGPLQDLTAGTLVRAEVTTRERRPLELLLPALRRVSGTDR